MTAKTKTRRFKLKNALSFYQKEWVVEVIESIEKDELFVYNPKDENAFCNSVDENGAELILSRAKTPISIKEWLPVGCQCIRLAGKIDTSSESAVACYSNNGAAVLWPDDAEYEPEGPSAFLGEIIILESASDKYSEHKFKFIMAHELVHVFDIMQYLVPAFIDWRSFWRCVLHEGCSCDLLNSQFDNKSRFVDSYGEENELAMIQEYWPSQANVWFDAFRQTNDGK